jgi:hypothetical protein
MFVENREAPMIGQVSRRPARKKFILLSLP